MKTSVHFIIVIDDIFWKLAFSLLAPSLDFLVFALRKASYWRLLRENYYRKQMNMLYIYIHICWIIPPTRLPTNGLFKYLWYNYSELRPFIKLISPCHNSFAKQPTLCSPNSFEYIVAVLFLRGLDLVDLCHNTLPLSYSLLRKKEASWEIKFIIPSHHWRFLYMPDISNRFKDARNWNRTKKWAKLCQPTFKLLESKIKLKRRI